MFIGGIITKKRMNEILTAQEKLVISYIEKTYKPFKYLSTEKSDTQYGQSWYLKFTKGSILKNTYQDFVVRISDHAVGQSRGTSDRHIYLYLDDKAEIAKRKIDDFLNPGKPVYKYEKDSKIVEGSSILRALGGNYVDPKLKYKEIETCIRKNKKGECINKYEIEIFKPVFVGVERPKYKAK